jgi:hypothetical protein
MANSITAGNSSNGGTAISTDTSGTLNIVTGSGSGATAIAIDSSQNVAIGTNTPVSALTLGNSKVLGWPNSTGGYNGTTLGTQVFKFSDNNLYIDNLDASTNTIFRRNGPTETMRLDSSGNLLIGCTTALPGYLNSTTGSSIDSGGTASFSKTGNVTMTVNNNTSGNQLIWFAYQGTTKGNIVLNGTTGVLYTTTSDYRLKQDVQPMTGALDRVAQLKPVTYKWKSDGSDGEGFIAHELQAVVPEAVTGEKDAVNEDGSIKPQGIDTSILVATLTAAIQEQQTMILELKAELNALKAKAGE